MDRVQHILDIIQEYKKYSEKSEIDLDSFEHIIKRLLLGGVLTLNFKREKAYINYYVGNNTEEINFEYGCYITYLSFAEMESGNLETREDHYISSFILKNENELKSIKTINKFNL